ncbi:MAG TPA: hypothetical protein VEA61_12545 [Allosphingosinicella sp.]|nr:hypothetical protein [Allosphingosinicella sp.]
MADTLEALFGAGLLPKTDFPPESRYHNIGVRVFTSPDGMQVPYLAPRVVPDPDRYGTLSVHVVSQGERLDQIAARTLGNPELHWRLCDANGAIWPDELEVSETRVRITLPADVPGAGESS